MIDSVKVLVCCSANHGDPDIDALVSMKKPADPYMNFS